MDEALSMVEEFHNAFGIENGDKPTKQLTAEEVALRFRLMAEENEEYKSAAIDNDTVEIADALGDMLYILMGTILKHGMGHIIAPVFREIQASNMSKLGADGKPILREDGKVLKGPNYFKPDIESIIKKA
ncbi:pyrophosphohydrolase domain-containing protein [Luteibaculum oceani]|uniref:hypothetical protein n=1 Tax=Luteibaculum oceani TaxID=1294296 RepID=UPI003744A57F